MGWIDGGSVFETQIIELYNANLLTKEILEKIAEPFKETDCDTAGFHDIKAKDGKDPVLKQVNYYIFDKNETENNKHLNHNDNHLVFQPTFHKNRAIKLDYKK